MTWDWSFAWGILPELLEGLAVTVQITLIGSAIAMVLGLVIAVVRHSKLPVISALVGGLVQFIRGTPLLVQAFFLFYVFPSYGLTLPALTTGIIAIGIHYSAYAAEAYRAGIESVPRGQWEAATALSLSPRRRWTGVVLPQAIRAVIPSLGNYVIAMFKDSAILAAITVVEVLNTAQAIGSDSFRYLEPLTLAGLLYLLVSYPAAKLIRRLEHRLA
ncbi:MAG: ectoine/hydroxyectoine ABC transporter permease subunit EhuD [Solirubrobacteraceae bacterium]